jgi:hypothetical protein
VHTSKWALFRRQLLSWNRAWPSDWNGGRP